MVAFTTTVELARSVEASARPAAAPAARTNGSTIRVRSFMTGSTRPFPARISGLGEPDLLRAFPEKLPSELPEVLAPLDDRREVVAGELACLAREVDVAVGEQNLGLAHTAR